MVTKRMEEALNQQINREFYSAYLYLSMSASCNALGMSGAEHWFRMQYDEEILHMSKMFDWLMQHGGQAKLTQIAQPLSDFTSLVAIFEESLSHEQSVTASINDLLDIAVEERDHATQVFLQWFITEQVEEEATVQDIVHKLRMAGENGAALMMIDDKLGGRPTPNPPAAE